MQKHSKGKRKRRRKRRSSYDRKTDKYYTMIKHPKDFFFDCNRQGAKLALYNPLEDVNLKSFYKLKVFQKNIVK